MKKRGNYTKFEVNFIDQPDMVSYLNAEVSAEEFLVKLKMIMPEDCKEHETVVFFDEIQKCPEIVTKIKFLVDEGSYKYVMSGSLLDVVRLFQLKLNRERLINRTKRWIIL